MELGTIRKSKSEKWKSNSVMKCNRGPMIKGKGRWALFRLCCGLAVLLLLLLLLLLLPLLLKMIVLLLLRSVRGPAYAMPPRLHLPHPL